MVISGTVGSKNVDNDRVKYRLRDQTISLSSGKSCHLSTIRNDLIPNYYLLSFPVEHGQPTAAEVTEMLDLGVGHAQELAGELLGDKEAFTVLYSGYSARREKGWHVHIVLLGNRWRKAWLYFVLAGKYPLALCRRRTAKISRCPAGRGSTPRARLVIPYLRRAYGRH